MFVQTWSKTVALELVMRVGLLGSDRRSVLLCKESTCRVFLYNNRIFGSLSILNFF